MWRGESGENPGESVTVKLLLEISQITLWQCFDFCRNREFALCLCALCGFSQGAFLWKAGEAVRCETFSRYHPAVNLCYFVCVLAMSMSTMHPVCLLLCLVCGFAYLTHLRGLGGMARQVGYLLPLLLGMALLNPLFGTRGETVLFSLPGFGPITLESVCYGLASAAMMGGCIVWFNCLNVIFTSDKIIFLFGRIVPALSLMISMTMRFLPRFKSHLQNTLQVQRAMHAPQNKRQQLSQVLTAFSATVSWAMEQSVFCADSMKSRGYGIPGRTNFSVFTFEKRDALVMCFTVLLTLGACLPHWTGHMAFAYLPHLQGLLLGPWQLMSYGCLALVCLLPMMLDWKEERKWQYLKSKI